MNAVNLVLRWTHVALGAIGLVAFWVPVFSKKGSKLHVAVGHVFLLCAYGAAGTALVTLAVRIGEDVTGRAPLRSYATVVLLGYLAVVTLALARHAALVVQTRKNPSLIQAGYHRLLLRSAQVASVLIVLYALLSRPPSMWILLGMSPIGLLTGVGMIRYVDQPTRLRMGWLYEHIGAILGTGIAFHTAFAVFGAARLFQWKPGPLVIVAWLGPTIIGIPVIALWTRHYRRKFNE